MRDKPDFKCYGKNYDPGLCRQCTHAVECRDICQKIFSAKKALPTFMLMQALDAVSNLLRGSNPEFTRERLSKITFTHNGQKFGIDTILSGFLDGSLLFAGLAVEVEKDPNAAPMKKLGKPLSEVFAEDDKEREEARAFNAANAHIPFTRKPRFLKGDGVSFQTEAECLDNQGIEEYFDKGITYIVEHHIQQDMLWVIDRFGEKRECFRDRFSEVPI